jgi:prepilin-type N-terminal cleavage/methylation domain-containing protein
MSKRKGFTLIELLVVVLIIGILAAIALPQYNKAVLKSRTAQAALMLKAITDAQERYYLETGAYTNNIKDLDVVVPDELIGAWGVAGDSARPMVYLYACASNRTCAATVYSADMPYLEFTMKFDPSYKGKHWCQVSGNKSNTARTVCASMGAVDAAYAGGNYYLIN